jgi:hypothetical protein
VTIQQMLLASETPPPHTYATWNFFDKAASVSLSNGDLTATIAYTGVDRAAVRAGLYKSSGKWYWEIHVDTHVAEAIGVAGFTMPLDNYVGQTADSWGYFFDGHKLHNGSSTAYGATYGASDTIGVALDIDNGTLEFFKNGTSQGQITGVSGSFFLPAVSQSGFGTPVMTANFGATAFTYSPPSGFTFL